MHHYRRFVWLFCVLSTAACTIDQTALSPDPGDADIIIPAETITRSADAGQLAARDVGPDVAPKDPCKPGSFRCTGMARESCDDQGRWNAAACPFLCADGKCTGECKPGAAQCAGKALRRCSAAGRWMVEAQCPASCSAGA